jgi:hypothetical protein
VNFCVKYLQYQEITMTTKQYRTAMGKVVDMGAIMLQNENTRAVGNMNVNARGDRINASNQVIDKKVSQANRQYKKQTAATQIPVATSNAAVKRQQAVEMPVDIADTFSDLPSDNDLVATPTPADDAASELKGGLAAAIAKSKTIQQTKLPTPREAAKAAGVRKI